MTTIICTEAELMVTYPLQQLPNIGVEADRNPVECTIKTAPSQPLTLSVCVGSCRTIVSCCCSSQRVQRSYLLHSLHRPYNSYSVYNYYCLTKMHRLHRHYVYQPISLVTVCKVNKNAGQIYYLFQS